MRIFKSKFILLLFQIPVLLRTSYQSEWLYTPAGYHIYHVRQNVSSFFNESYQALAESRSVGKMFLVTKLVTWLLTRASSYGVTAAVTCHRLLLHTLLFYGFFNILYVVSSVGKKLLKEFSEERARMKNELFYFLLLKHLRILQRSHVTFFTFHNILSYSMIQNYTQRRLNSIVQFPLDLIQFFRGIFTFNIRRVLYYYWK